MISKETTDDAPAYLKNEWETEEFLMTQQRLLLALERLGVESGLAEPLKQPKRSISVVLPIRMEDLSC